MITPHNSSNNPSYPSNNPALKKAMAVSELNRQVKRLLEASYNHIWVSGELSGLSRPGSGHWYFSLKDDKAQIRCAMFRGFNQKLKFQPQNGDKVILRAKVSLYEGRGDYQLIVEDMEPAGLGQLQAAFEALKLKLSQEGLFDQALKKPLPKMPSKVAVITSATGAVIHDIISVSQRRFPMMEIVLVPVMVQGEGAAMQIASAIKFVNDQKLADLIIAGRGGGSLEDLWAFNEEVVARAIFDSQLPIVSAVGHEVDFTIADLVADYRAPTPSAAAEQITPDQYELMQWLDQQQRRTLFLIQNTTRRLEETLRHNARQLKHPGETLKEKTQRVAELRQRLSQQLLNQLALNQQQLLTIQSRLERHHPRELLIQKSERLEQASHALFDLTIRTIETKQHQLSMLAQTLNTASPLATLGRGYAIISSDSQRAVSRSKDVKIGDTVTARLKEGSLKCSVTSISSK